MQNQTASNLPPIVNSPIMEQLQLKPCGSAYLGIHQLTPPNKYHVFETGISCHVVSNGKSIDLCYKNKVRWVCTPQPLKSSLRRVAPQKALTGNQKNMKPPEKCRFSHGASQLTFHFIIFHFVYLAELSITVNYLYRSFAQKPCFYATWSRVEYQKTDAIKK